MTPYFNTPFRVARLRAVAEGWNGTPYCQNSAVRGRQGGVSCHNLIARVLIESGALPEFTPPKNTSRGSGVRRKRLMLEFVKTVPQLQPSTEAIAPGDLILFSFGHLAVALEDGWMIHCLTDEIGTVIGPWKDATWQSRVETVWRPMECPAWAADATD